MRVIPFSLLLALFLATLLVAEPSSFFARDSVAFHRLAVKQQVIRNVQEETGGATTPSRASGELSVKKAVVFSALIPGTGQAYAKSYWKSALFLGVEIGAWALNIVYNKKGRDREAEFKIYADQRWSERRYFSYIYYQLLNNGVLNELFQTFTDEMGRPIIADQDYTPETVNLLRQYESDQYPGLSGFTHRLPHTKTQQYYEMIGKYPAQFGNAWDDASFDVKYDGYRGRMTPHNAYYMDMRDESNHFFKIAGYGAMAVLANHVISAIDAGFTARNHNRKVKMQVSYRSVPIQYQLVDMFGVSLNW